MRAGYQCDSEDQHIGDFTYVSECANACPEISDCNYFIFGGGGKAGSCFWEKAESVDCPEGWIEAEFFFYQAISMLI